MFLADHLLQSSSGFSHFVWFYVNETPHDAQNEFDSKTLETPDRTLTGLYFLPVQTSH